MCVYLFLQVRATPAVAQPAAIASAKDDVPDDSETEGAPQDKPTPGRRVAGMRNLAKSTNDSTSTSPTPSTTTPALEDDKSLMGPKLDAVMAEANKAYDKQDFDEARAIAQRVLKQHPTNVRMLRIMTSSHCIEADTAEAQKYFNLLPPADREQMKTRCSRYGITFSEPPAK